MLWMLMQISLQSFLFALCHLERRLRKAMLSRGQNRFLAF